MIRDLSREIQAFVVPEINAGQIALEVERCSCGNAATVPVNRLGGAVFQPQEIVDAILATAKGTKKTTKKKAPAKTKATKKRTTKAKAPAAKKSTKKAAKAESNKKSTKKVGR